MDGLNGKYEFIKDENVIEYYKTIGVPDAFIGKVTIPPPSLEITVSGSSVVINPVNRAIALDKEFDDKLPTGRVAKCVATVDGNILTITSTLDGKKGGQLFELNSEGILVWTLTFEESSVVGKRYYKRV